jgi:hypothetical protein
MLVGSYRRFEDRSAFVFSVKQSKTLKMKALRYFETSVNIYRSEQRNFPEDLNVQSNSCRDLPLSSGELLRRAKWTVTRQLSVKPFIMALCQNGFECI